MSDIPGGEEGHVTSVSSGNAPVHPGGEFHEPAPALPSVHSEPPRYPLVDLHATPRENAHERAFAWSGSVSPGNRVRCFPGNSIGAILNADGTYTHVREDEKVELREGQTFIPKPGTEMVR